MPEPYWLVPPVTGLTAHVADVAPLMTKAEGRMGIPLRRVLHGQKHTP